VTTYYDLLESEASRWLGALHTLLGEQRKYHETCVKEGIQAVPEYDEEILLKMEDIAAAADMREEKVVDDAVSVAALSGYPDDLRDILLRHLAKYASEDGNGVRIPPADEHPLARVRRFERLVSGLHDLGHAVARRLPGLFSDAPTGSLAMARGRVMERQHEVMERHPEDFSAHLAKVAAERARLQAEMER
jgi:formate dehydrogenase maturation protein FdhE